MLSKIIHSLWCMLAIAKLRNVRRVRYTAKSTSTELKDSRMTETKTYFTDTGLVLSVRGDIARLALRNEHRLGGHVRVCDPATFFDDPLRHSASDLNGRRVKLGEPIFILEGSGYAAFPAPISGTLQDVDVGTIRDNQREPSRTFISIKISNPEELETLSTDLEKISPAIESESGPSRYDDPLNQYPSILKCLGGTGCNIFHVQKTGDQFRLVDACDWHYEATLTKQQLLRLSDELRRLAELDDVDPHFLKEHVE